MKLLQEKLLLEGGAAAEQLITKKLQPVNKTKLHYSKISQNDLGYVFDHVIKEILDGLKSNGVIADDYVPQYTLGSTRLAADIAGRPIKKWNAETDSVVAQAKMSKQNFGDLDIDLELSPGKKVSDISAVINGFDQTKYAFLNSGNEINVAVKITNDTVIQLDLVDVTNKRGEVEFNQSSSMYDMSKGLKGVWQKILIACVVQSMDLDSSDKIKAGEIISKNPEIQKLISNGYKLSNMGRFLLGSTGVRLVVDLTKEGVKTRRTVNIDDTPRIGISDLDKLAIAILQNDGASKEEVFHALKMAEFIKTHKPEKVNEVWTKLIQKATLSKESGKMDDENYLNGLTQLGKALGVSDLEINKATGK